MTKIYLYAEILTQIRTLNLYASLQTEKREGTKVDVSTDKKVITVTHDGETQRLYLPTQIRGDASITFPLQKTTEISARVQIEDEHEWKFSISNEIQAPWLAPDLQDSTQIQCRKCKTEILASGKIVQWKDLPSENWAELMDIWFCRKPHDDPSLGDAAEAKGFSSKSKVAVTPGTGMTDLISFVLHAGDCTNVKAAETRKSPDVTVLRCSTCATMLGTTSQEEDVLRLHKSSLALRNDISAPFLIYSLPIFTCAQILSLIESTALKRFVIHGPNLQNENEEGAEPLIIWVFNPDIYYSCSAFDGNGILTNGKPVGVLASNTNNDDTSQIYDESQASSSNKDFSPIRSPVPRSENPNPHGDDMSQIYGEPSGPQIVKGNVQIEVPVREKPSSDSTKSGIPVEAIQETETNLVTSEPSNKSTKSVQDAQSMSEPSNEHINLVHRAAKIFYKSLPKDTTATTFLDANSTTHEELYMPDISDLISLRETLEKTNTMLPSSARVFQDWNVGLLDRYERVPSGLGVMQENPLARGIKAKDGRVTRWDLGHGAEGLYA